MKFWYHRVAVFERHDPTDSWWTSCDDAHFSAEAARQFERMRWSRFAQIPPSPEGRQMGSLDLWRARKQMRGHA